MRGPRAAALVADDEKPALDDLSYLLRTAFGVAVDTARDAGEVFRRVRERGYDVVFLDVAMPGLDGIEVAGALRQFTAPPALVIVTAHEEYAVRAFDVGICDYLLKPVSRARLGVALERALAQGRQRAVPGAGQRAGAGREPAAGPAGEHAAGYAGAGEAAPAIPVQTGGRTRLVSRDDIRWVEARGDYVRLHMADGEAHLVRVPISRLARMWADSGFVRIHRGYLVPFKYVTEFSAVGGSHTVTIGGRSLPVSRRHVRDLRDRISGAVWRG